MSDDGQIQQIAQAAFRAVQARAKADFGGNTAPLLTVYAVESFLRRLALSPYAHKMVLKGGMLMAAKNIRRMTKELTSRRAASPTTRNGSPRSSRRSPDWPPIRTTASSST